MNLSPFFFFLVHVFRWCHLKQEPNPSCLHPLNFQKNISAAEGIIEVLKGKERMKNVPSKVNNKLNTTYCNNL